MRRIFVLAATATLALVLGINVETRDALAAPATTQKMAVPSYFYPGAKWTQMEEAVPKVGLTIINPNSGPGDASDQAYVDQVKKSQAAGLTVLGYVHTSYGARDAAAVRAEVDKYYSWYGVDGIFFDEVSTDCSKATSYYADLHTYVKAKAAPSKVVINPGTQTNECYMSVADIVVNFEGSYKSYVSNYSAPSWVSKYSPDRFWHLVYSTSTTKALDRAMSLSKSRGAGWVYVTPDGLPNPWDTLPTGSYWSRHLSALG